MARREYYLSPQCAHDGCGERAHYVFTTRREQDETRRDLEKRPWRCIRHSQPDAVLSAETPSREKVLESYETDFGYGRSVHRFWAPVGATKGGNGFAHGPGFKAFARDFPAGTRLIVTARVELPAEALGGQRVSLPRGYNEAGAEWLEPWCDEHPDLDGQGCVACIGASHDAWMHRAKAAEREVGRLREALSTAADDLDKAANQFEGIRQAQKAGHEVPVVSNSRVFAAKAQRAREALEAGER